MTSPSILIGIGYGTVKPRMTTAAIMHRLDTGTANTADRRVYVSRVERSNRWARSGTPCRHGHYDCAAIEGGPCSDEVASGLPEETDQ